MIFFVPTVELSLQTTHRYQHRASVECLYHTTTVIARSVGDPKAKLPISREAFNKGVLNDPLPASIYIEILAEVKKVLGEFGYDEALKVVSGVEAGVIEDFREAGYLSEKEIQE